MSEPRVTVAKIVEWLGAIPLLIISAAVLLATLADRLTFLGVSIFPTLPSSAPSGSKVLYQLLKLLILLSSLSSAAIAVDRLLHFARLETGIKEISKDIETIAHRETDEVHILRNRAEWYSCFLNKISQAPHGSLITITAYEKLKMPFESGEENSERALMELYDRRVLGGELRVEQLVHVATLDDLGAARRRVDAFASAPNFTLTAVLGVAPDPLVEFAVVGDETVICGFSTQSGSPYSVESGWVISSKEIAALYLSHARLWSSSFGRPLKTRDAVQESTFEELTTMLPSGYALDLPPSLGLTSLRMARDRDLYPRIGELIGSLEAIDATGGGLQRRRFGEITAVAAAVSVDIARGRVEFSGNGLVSLHRMLHEAESSISAVCPQSALGFWSTSAGIALEREMKAAARRGVDVARIFLYEGDWQANTTLVELAERHRNDGVTVSLAAPGGNLMALGSVDFLIIDNEEVFEDRLNGDSCVYLPSSSLAAGFMETWAYLQQIAEPLR